MSFKLFKLRKSVENLAGRKYTGGRKVPSRSRRKFEIDRYPNEAVTGEQKLVVRGIRGGNTKTAFKSAKFVNITDRENKKTTKVVIARVVKNPANKDYERRGVISKGAIVETELGLGKIVSRPGQDGTVNAILMK